MAFATRNVRSTSTPVVRFAPIPHVQSLTANGRVEPTPAVQINRTEPARPGERRPSKNEPAQIRVVGKVADMPLDKVGVDPNFLA